MKELFIAALPTLYGSIAAIAIAGYVPQIYRLARSQSHAEDMSLITWWLWLSTWIISATYGIFILADWRFCMIAMTNIMGHTAIIGLTIYHRYFRAD
jgi:hypothetical protein